MISPGILLGIRRQHRIGLRLRLQSVLDQPRGRGRLVVDADPQLASNIRRQRIEVGAGPHLVEALALGIDQRVGRTVVGRRRRHLVVAGGHAHHDVAAKVFAGQLVAQRVADEVHALRERIVLHRQPELLCEQLGDPVLEAFALDVRKRQIARGRCTAETPFAPPRRRRCRSASAAASDAATRQATPARGGDSRSARAGVVDHCFSSSTFARVMSPSDRPLRYA